MARKAGADAVDYLGLTLPRKSDLLVGIIVVVVFIVVADGTSWLLRRDIVTQFQLDIYRTASTVGWLHGCCLVVVAPIGEETLFRGVLLQRWSLKWGVARALLVSSVLFGVLHADILGHTVFGVIMGLLYVRTRGLWIPMACHALTNAIAVAGQALPWDAKDKATTVAEFRHDWYIGALALAIAVPLLYAMRSHFWPPRGWGLPQLAPNNPITT